MRKCALAHAFPQFFLAKARNRNAAKAKAATGLPSFGGELPVDGRQCPVGADMVSLCEEKAKPRPPSFLFFDFHIDNAAKMA